MQRGEIVKSDSKTVGFGNIDDAMLFHLIRCVVRVHFIFKLPVPPASLVVRQVKSLWTIFNLNEFPNWNNQAVGIVMINFLGLVSESEYEIAETLGEFLFINREDGDREQQENIRLVKILYPQSELKPFEIIRREDAEARKLMDSLKGDCFRKRAVAALLLAVESVVDEQSVHDFVSRQDRIALAYRQAGELGGFIYRVDSAGNRAGWIGWSNAFCAAITALSGNLWPATRISQRDLRIVTQTFNRILLLDASSFLLGVSMIFDTLNVVRECTPESCTSEEAVLRAMTMFEHGIENGFPEEARPGKIDWKALGVKANEVFREINAHYDGPQDS